MRLSGCLLMPTVTRVTHCGGRGGTSREPTDEDRTNSRRTRARERRSTHPTDLQLTYAVYVLIPWARTAAMPRDLSVRTEAYARSTTVSCVAKSLTGSRRLCKSRNGPSVILVVSTPYRSTSCRPTSLRIAPP